MTRCDYNSFMEYNYSSIETTLVHEGVFKALQVARQLGVLQYLDQLSVKDIAALGKAVTNNVPIEVNPSEVDGWLTEIKLSIIFDDRPYVIKFKVE